MTTEAMAPTTAPDPAGRESARRRRRRRGPGRPFLLGSLGIIMVLLSWEVAAASGLVDATYTSRPSDLVGIGYEYYAHGSGPTDLKTSATEFVLGFALAVVIGLSLGFAIGWWKWLDELLDPVINFLNASPRIAFVPLIVVWFGIGITSKVAVVALTAVFPMVLSARAGVRIVEPTLLRVAWAFHASQLQAFRTVVLPTSVPSVVTGIRLAVGQGLIGMVVGEFIASTAGLGYTMLVAGSTFQPGLVWVALFTVAGAGVAMTTALRSLERRLESWRP